MISAIPLGKVYQVERLFGWVNSHPEKHIRIPIDKLLTFIRYDHWIEFESLKREHFRSILKDSSYQKRMKRVKLDHPLIISNDHRLIDGLTRLVKSVFEKKEYVKVVFVSQAQLNQTLSEDLSVIPSHVDSLPFPDQYLSLPKSSLPSDSLKRREIVEEYFPDFLPSVKEGEDDQYTICLERPSSPYGCYLFDEGLRDGLAWWKPGTRVRDIPAEYRLFENGILALEEQWVPLSWSSTFNKLGYIPEELVLLHLDDHQDMMAPRMGKRLDGALIDYISGEEVDFLNPDSVRSSIESGAIGKGSILTPLIWNVSKIHVRHLCFRTHPASSYHIERVTEMDNILFKDPNRIGLKFEKVDRDKLCEQSNYVVTPDVSLWLEDLPPNVPVFLHFDLDYFNDRLDGDSNWQARAGSRSFNPDYSVQKKQLNNIFKLIEQAKIKGRILNISIGISPGFYPAEFWQRMVEDLERKISKLGFDGGGFMSSRVTMSSTTQLAAVVERSTARKRERSIDMEREAEAGRRIPAPPGSSKKSYVSEDQVSVRKMTSKQFEGWKVLLDDKACGYVKFHPKVDEIFHRHVTVDFAIPQAKRGMHIGRFALQKAIGASIHTLFVAHLRKSNLPSRKALEAVGFEETKDGSKQLCMTYTKV